jgi:hypothetical protein
MTRQGRLKTTVALIDTASDDVLRRQSRNTTSDGATDELTTRGDTGNRGRAELALVIGKTAAHNTRATLLLIALKLFSCALDTLRIGADTCARTTTVFITVIALTMDCTQIAVLLGAIHMRIFRALLR